MTTKQFITERQYLKNVSVNTLDWYRDSFNAFADALDSKASVVQRITELRQRGVAAVSVNTYLRCINALFQLATAYQYGFRVGWSKALKLAYDSERGEVCSDSEWGPASDDSLISSSYTRIFEGNLRYRLEHGGGTCSRCGLKSGAKRGAAVVACVYIAIVQSASPGLEWPYRQIDTF